MANAVAGSVRIDLTMNAAAFEKDAGRARTAMAGLGRAISDISARINSASIFFNTGVLAAQRFATAASGIFQVASAFEKGMANVSTLIDTNTESLAKMSKEVLGIGQRTPVAISELTSALYDIRSAGISAGDALGVLERSAQLAVAGLGTTKEAADLVTSALNAFGLAGEDAAGVYDVIFKTVKAGKTTISGLAQGFGAVAGTVANAGIKIDDYLASVAALTTTGLQASIAHTQLRAAIAGLLRETAETKALFDALNVKTFKELIKQSGSVGTAFQRIARAVQGNDAMIIKIFGSVEAYNAVVGIAGAQNKAYLATLISMRDGTNAVDEAFKKQNATLDATLKTLRNNIESVATSIGGVLTPTINQIADHIADLAKKFTELSPETQEMVAHLIAFVGVVAPAVIALGFFTNAIASLVPVVMGVVTAFSYLTGGLAALIAAGGPLGLLVAALGVAGAAWLYFRDDAVTALDQTTAHVNAKVDEIIQKIEGLATIRMGFLDEQAWEGLTKGTQAVSEHTKTVQGMAQAWKTTTEANLPASAAAFQDGFVKPVAEGLTELEKLWKRHNDEALRFGKQVIKEIATPQEELIDRQNRLKAALDAGGLSSEQYGRAMQRATLVSANAYTGMASDIAGSLSQVFGESKGFAIAQAIINTAEGITKALSAYPPPFNFAAAAAVGAAGAAQIAAIRSTNKGGGGGGGGGGGAAAAGAQGPTQIPQAVTVNLHGKTYDREHVFGLIDQINDAGKDGKHVIVRAA